MKRGSDRRDQSRQSSSELAAQSAANAEIEPCANAETTADNWEQTAHTNFRKDACAVVDCELRAAGHCPYWCRRAHKIKLYPDYAVKQKPLARREAGLAFAVAVNTLGIANPTPPSTPTTAPPTLKL